MKRIGPHASRLTLVLRGIYIRAKHRIGNCGVYNNTMSASVKSETEWKQEDQYLQAVIEAWNAEVNARRNLIGQLRREAKESDTGDISAGTLLYHVAQSNASALDKLQQAAKPYFGRIDFLDGEDDERLNIYIGEVSIRGEGSLNCVFDWRAPIGGLFYRGRGGRTFYSAPSGNITGDLELKRHFEIEDGTLQSMYDAFGGAAAASGQDEMLVGLLNRTSSASMRKIVQSIQEEQDEVIRATADVLVVQGPAGSGKTVVALHRAAYLLYQMNQRQSGADTQVISAQGMLVFSPNRIFSSYIANVLPDLREDEIRQTIFELHIREQLINRLGKSAAESARIETKDQYDERVLAGDFPITLAESRWLGSSDLLKALEDYVTGFDGPIEEMIRNLDLGAESSEDAPDILVHDEIIRQFRQRRGEASVIDRLSDVSAYADKVRLEIEQALNKADIGPDRRSSLQRQRTHVAGIHRELVLEQDQLRGRSLSNLYADFWKSPHAGSHRPSRTQSPRTHEEAGNVSISYEDGLPMLCLSGLYRGFPRFRDIHHAIVDEAQEYSPLHFEYLKRCLPRTCRLTIVGDLNQTSNEALGLSDYANLETIFPGRVTRLNLTHSYRSSKEISELAGRILGPGFIIESVRRTRERPRVIEVPVPEEVPAAVVREVRRLALIHPTVAVIAKTTEACDALREALRREWPDLQQLSRDSAKIPSGVLIVPLHLAKGLEFDAVLVADADSNAYGAPSDRRLLYIACTRALHALALCYCGQRSPYLPDIEEDLFEYELVRDASELLYIYDYEVLTNKRTRVTALARAGRESLAKVRSDFGRLTVEIDSEVSQTLADTWTTIQEYARLAPGASRSELDAISDHLQSRGWKTRVARVAGAYPALLALEAEKKKREQMELEQRRDEEAGEVSPY